MRHQKAGRKLNRSAPHRKAMFSNMVAALIKNGRIETTEAKAKELRRYAEPTINWAVRVADLELKGRKKQTQDERARVVHAIRMAQRVCRDSDALDKLFHEIGPGYMSRPGGYTRILKTRVRRGDAAPMALIELMPLELPKKSKKKADDKDEGKKAAKSKKASKSKPADDQADAKSEKKAAKASKKAAAPKADDKKEKKASKKKTSKKKDADE